MSGQLTEDAFRLLIFGNDTGILAQSGRNIKVFPVSSMSAQIEIEGVKS